MAEQLAVNQWAAGSNPALGARKSGRLLTAVFPFFAGEGENPLGSPGEDSEPRPDFNHGLASDAAGLWA